MKLLFVCTGNTCRSPMAEHLFRKAAAEAGVSEKYFCASAGLAAREGDAASVHAVAACRDFGLDLSGHRAHLMTAQDCTEYDLFAVMGRAAAQILQAAGVPQEKIVLLGDPVADPYGGTFASYCTCRDQLSAAVQRLLENLEAGNAE